MAGCLYSENQPYQYFKYIAYRFYIKCFNKEKPSTHYCSFFIPLPISW
uniref:Uncharacterized protein n=1 Tax=Arundo donax TaxID=35708 RepID=A0A0A9HG28_ARUDO